MKKINFLIALTIIVTSCLKPSIPPPPPQVIPVLATLTTANEIAVKSTSATSSGDVTKDGGAAVNDKGFCIDTIPNPTKDKNGIPCGFDAGPFTYNHSGLKRNTKYYVRTYATNSAGTAYGNEVSFTTRNEPTMFDYDGNIYNTVNIGTQVWMMENLNTTHYRNGDPIPQFTGIVQWMNLTTGAWSHCNNQADFDTAFGKFYNWYSVNDARGLAPIGWHIPSDAEWTILTNFLGGVPGRKMKAENFDDLNFLETNESGFSALSAGYLGSDTAAYSFQGPGLYGNYQAYWWSTTENGITAAWGRGLSRYSDSVNKNFDFTNLKSHGLSVRCIKD